MIRAIMAILAVSFGTQVQAKQMTVTDVLVGAAQQVLQQTIMDDVHDSGLHLVVGDTANYNMDMGITKGTMKVSVLSIDQGGAWIQQLVEMGFFGKQDIRILMDPNTGEVKKVLVNGQEQSLPNAGNYELVETKEDTVRVPAGTFVCLYIKAKDKSNNEEVQQWVNLKDIPVMGLVKSIMPSQLGPVTLELTSFKKN